MNTFERLQSDVVLQGLCTHCGTCVGLAHGTLEMRNTKKGPIPFPTSAEGVSLDEIAYIACPGKGLNYPNLNEVVFGEQPKSWLYGNFRRIYIGYSRNEDIRRKAASGGILTQTLIYLLQNGLIEGAIVLEQGVPTPWQSRPKIALSREEIIAACQSVYIPTSINTIIDETIEFEGKLGYVGLPDQVASLRSLQKADLNIGNNIEYVLGPFVGTSIYLEAIKSFLRSNGVRDLSEVREIRYREGEWPGFLQIRTKQGLLLRAKKFYYNYLIPFYITNSSLFSVDFTNELTDISVGDAWHPGYEKRGAGFSVVVARTEKGEEILDSMRNENIVSLDEIGLEEALSMHGHMLDFKKRGTFIRIAWLEALKKKSPEFGYKPKNIPVSRKITEGIISGGFLICHTSLFRRLIEVIPIRIVGPIFDFLRLFWKRLSKPTKRRGLSETEYQING